MKKQWQDFLDSQQTWSYNIVPSVVQQLDNAVQAQDDRAIKSAVIALNTQGVTLHDDKLMYLQDLILDKISEQTETMTVAEVAQELDCTKSNIYYLIKKGKLSLYDNNITVASVEAHKKTRKNGRPTGSYKTK